MTIDDISLVTQALRTVIESVQLFPGPPAVFATTTPQSPQAVLGGKNLVSVYLFHLIEDADFKNQPPRAGTGRIPIQHTPLGLNLYYVITAHNPDNSTDTDLRVLQEQRLLGLVAKAVHDHPVLSLGDDDRFEVVLRPVPIAEAVQFWSSDEQHLTRPSLFLEARVIFLDIVPPKTVPGIVLSVGSFVFLGVGPQLSTTRSTLTFVAPAVGARQVQAEPARVALFEPGDEPFDTSAPPHLEVATQLRANNQLTIAGAQFGRGPHFLDLTRGATRVRLNLDTPPLQNKIWEIFIASGTVTLRFWTAVFDELSQRMIPNAGPPPVPPLLPGTYTARFVDSEPPRPRSSNEIAFTVVPQIKAVTRSGTNSFTLVVMGTYLQTPGLDIQLVVGAEILVLGTGSSSPGEYSVSSGSTIDFQRTPSNSEVIDVDHPLAVNLIINGANATPAWITAP